MIYTAEKDGRYITELRVNDGENIAVRCLEFDPEEGWADVLVMNDRGWPQVRYDGMFDSMGKVVTERLEGVVTFVDSRREGG